MEKGRGIWLSRSLSKSFVRQTRQQEDYLYTKMVLNLMAVVGFIFFLIVLLYLIYGLHEKLAFYVYISLCIVLELIVIAGWLYVYYRESASSSLLTNDDNDDVEEVRDSSMKQNA